MRKVVKWIGSAAVVISLLVAPSFLCTASAAARQNATKKATTPQVNPDDYAGAEVCSGCHSDEAQQLQKTPMAVLLTDKYPIEQRGCEACHGPGKAHVDALSNGNPDFASLIYSPARHTPQENAIRCLGCHQEKRLLGGKEKDEKQSLFHRSRHLGAGVTCIDCHDPHLLPPKEGSKPGLPLQAMFNVPRTSTERDWLNNRLLRQTEPTLCYSCHQERQADFQLPVRHRVNEGVMKCTDCHNPHGTLVQRELKGAATEQVCYSCHVEKRGPFVYEHAPVRVEGCLACHVPHGSINRNLLIRRQDRQLCLECHVSPQAVNVPHPHVSFQTLGECTRCHVEIHGSNYQPDFLR